eukprot:TRINITY_DN4806_c0_g1_i1.p1 TRINITY_DN4806_c0_g1~~TRINITY_DN4806_c0_g1_i1.p1  ORF type:complete len:333 (+),score=85.73 TRINITY_DN4806_c0_g1_i1:117-1001(+)
MSGGGGALSAGKSIQLDQKTLHFPPPLDRMIENVITVTSTANRPVTYKMKTSAPAFYQVKKRSGFVGPCGTERISITFRGAQSDQHTPAARQKDKFQFEVRYLASDGSEDAAYRAIGCTSEPGDGDLVGAVRALNKSVRELGDGPPGSLNLPETANEAEILTAMWKSKKSFQPDKEDGYKLIACAFKEQLPQGMKVQPKSQQASSGQLDSSQMQSCRDVRPPAQGEAPQASAGGGGSAQDAERRIAAMQAELQKAKAQLREQERKASTGLPLWMAVVMVLLAFAVGWYLRPASS